MGGAEKKTGSDFTTGSSLGTSKYSGSEHRIGDERYAGEIHRFTITKENMLIWGRPWPQEEQRLCQGFFKIFYTLTMMLGTNLLLQQLKKTEL